MPNEKNPARKHQLINLQFLTLILVLPLTLASCSVNDGGASSESANGEAVEDADVVIAKDGVSEAATFIPVTADGVEMELIAVKAPDGTLRTAFNTCQVCYDSGRGYYVQDGGVLVCQNCGNRFEVSQVAVEKGGCNPVGIIGDMRTETDEEITIPLDLLKQAAPLFANWKNRDQ